ncbi:FlgD immunoglobulin-like domain containing protein [Calditrichota bacterium GD2]
MFFYFIFVAILSFSTLFSQTIDSVLVISDPEFVFSYEPNTKKQGTITLTCYDSYNQAVGANVPIMVEVGNAFLQGATLFKSEFNSDSTYNKFYFRTDGNGKVIIDYIPDEFLVDTYSNIKKNYLALNPDATEEDVLNEYRRYFIRRFFFSNVSFTNPNDDQTAYGYGNISEKKGSVFPVLYGYDQIIINGPAKDGSPYIFTAENYKAPPVNIEIQALDMFGNPLPAGVLIIVDCIWGRLYSDAIIHKTEAQTSYYVSPLEYNPSFSGGGTYVVKLKEQGRATFRYQPPPTTMAPFTHWANVQLSYNNYQDMEEAWRAYTSNAVIGYGQGTSVFDEIKGATWWKPWNDYMQTYALAIDSANSVVPALVGVDQISIEAESERHFNYVYASESYSEKAKIKIKAYDSYGRPVPKGAPVALMLNTRFSGGEKGTISGSDVVATAYAGSKELCFIVLMDEGGEAEVEYHAPMVPFRFEYYSGEDYKGLTYEEKYSGLFDFFPVPYYGWSWWGDTLNPPHWFLGYIYGSYSNPYVNTLRESSFGAFPVLLGPQQAEAWFHPSRLGPSKYMARLNVYVKDYFGNPAPRGSNIYITVGSGKLNGDKDALNAIVYGTNGKASVFYFSPTRSVWHTWSYDKIQVYQDGAGSFLKEKKIKLIGPAVSWHDFNLSNFILGFDVVDALTELNPLKAYGSLKEFVNYAEESARQNRELFNKIFSGTATDADFQAYEQRWQNLAWHIRHLAETIPNTSLTGPDLSAGDLFKGLSTNGIKHILINTLQEKLVKDPQKRMIKNFLEFHLSKFYPSEKTTEGKALFKVNSTYSYHIPKRMGKLEFLTDLFTIPSETGMYEMYGFKFRLHDLDSVVVNGVVNVGDQWAVEGFLIPARYSLLGYPQQALVLSNGFFEITEVNNQEDYLEGITIGYLFDDPRINPLLAFSKKVGAGADTLSDVFGTQLIIPKNALADSTHLFLVRTSPPMPLIEGDQKIVQWAQNIGSMAPDSSIQSVAFSMPASLVLIDSLSDAAGDPWQAYWFDESNQTWIKITDAQYQNDSLFTISIGKTGVYGVARSGFRHNEYPVLSSFNDTTIVMNRSLDLPFEAYDPEGQLLTLWAESNKSEVAVNLADSLLHVVPAENWTGVATVSLFATDGQDTSKSSFKLTVVDLTAIENLVNVPQKYLLYQNFPNPFNNSTTIRFDLPRAGRVKIEIFNALGQKVRTLLSNRLASGSYQVKWDGTDASGMVVSSGMYIYILRSQNFVQRKRMLLIK